LDGDGFEGGKDRGIFFIRRICPPFDRATPPSSSARDADTILGSKLFHPSVVSARFRSLSDGVTMAFNRVWIWSVAKANGFVLFRKLYFP